MRIAVCHFPRSLNSSGKKQVKLIKCVCSCSQQLANFAGPFKKEEEGEVYSDLLLIRLKGSESKLYICFLTDIFERVEKLFWSRRYGG